MEQILAACRGGLGEIAARSGGVVRGPAAAAAVPAIVEHLVA
jgi:hypothetical protein